MRAIKNTLLPFALVPALAGCSVSHVDIAIDRDLSGSFRTVMSVDRQLEQCAQLPKDLQNLKEDTLAANPAVAMPSWFRRRYNSLSLVRNQSDTQREDKAPECSLQLAACTQGPRADHIAGLRVQ